MISAASYRKVLMRAKRIGATMKKGYKQLLDEANAEVTAIAPTDAIPLLAQKDRVTFIDLRDPRELEREGRIPGAVHCPRGMLEFWIDPESPYHRPVFAEKKKLLFFCAGGWRSALAAKTAQDMGLDDVAHLEGGFTAWRQADGPIEGGQPAAERKS
jgi:rhodanese-related sulfurtransferase